MKERLTKILKSLNSKNIINSKTITIIFLVLGAIALLWDLSNTQSEPKEIPQDIATVDTLIPEGYVLVPIDIQNQASLDSMIGAFGVVDLFIQTSDKGSRRVAQKVKIIRAPLNPMQFAVLIKEENSSEIASYPGSFFVMVQNPNKRGDQFEKRKAKSLIITEDI